MYIQFRLELTASICLFLIAFKGEDDVNIDLILFVHKMSNDEIPIKVTFI